MPESNENMFFNSRVKIVRARHHIKELGEEIAYYLKTRPFRVVVEKDPDSDNHLWTLRVKNEVPPDLSDIIADAVHELRASLDLLASDLVSMAGGDAHDAGFPFGEDAGGFEKMIKQKHLDRAGDDVVEIVRSLKPCKGGNEQLFAIHELDASERHKTLAPSVHYTGIKDSQTARARAPLSTVDNIRCGPVHDGMVITSLPPASNARVGKTFQPSLKITFDEAPALSGRDAVEALGELASLAEKIINTFAEHFKTRGAS